MDTAVLILSHRFITHKLTDTKVVKKQNSKQLPSLRNFPQPKPNPTHIQTRSTMMRSNALLLSLVLLLSIQVQQTQGLAFGTIALAAATSRPSFLGRLKRSSPSSPSPQVAPTSPADVASIKTSVPVSSVSSSPTSFGFNEDEYRREMLSLVYDRSMERLVK